MKSTLDSFRIADRGAEVKAVADNAIASPDERQVRERADSMQADGDEQTGERQER